MKKGNSETDRQTNRPTNQRGHGEVSLQIRANEEMSERERERERRKKERDR